MFQTKPEIAADIDAVVDCLSSLSIGEVVTYSHLSGLLGRDILKDNGYILTRSKKRAERDLNCLFEVVRGVGIKRLAASESVKVGSAIMGHIRRSARNGLKRMENINANSLEPQEQSRLIAYRSQLGAVAYMAEAKKTDALAKKADGRVLPVGKVLDLVKE